jgi:hypothetical protein
LCLLTVWQSNGIVVVVNGKVRWQSNMALSGRTRFENRSAVKVADDGSVDYGLPPVRFGDTVIPARVAYVIDGAQSSPSLVVEFEIRDGRPFCSSVHVDASAEGRSIKTGDLTALPSLERLAEDAFAELAIRAPDSVERPFDAFIGADRAARSKARSDVHTRGDEELREVARVYRENIDGRPLEAVQALGYTRRTAARRVQQARDKVDPTTGATFLPKTTQGRRKA